MSQSTVNTKESMCRARNHLAIDKQDGPTAIIVFLCIIIDTIRQELRLPEGELRRLLHILDQLEKRKACTRRDLEVLIEVLHHACTVIRPGRSFLRRAIALFAGPSNDITTSGSMLSSDQI